MPMAWPRFSPFLLLEYTTASPVILAWTQLVSAFVAGLGMYAFCRRALGLGFWAAAVPAWCYPMTGFLVLSQGYPSSGAIYWFPWLMLAVDRAVEKPGAVTLAAVAASTALALISGQTDIAAQVMMASGLYGVWKIFGGGLASSAALAAKRTAWLATGWILGVMLASPHVLPLL